MAQTGGTHNVGLKHYRGLVIDVQTGDKTAVEVAAFIKICRACGLIVRDERRKFISQKVWTRAYLDIEI